MEFESLLARTGSTGHLPHILSGLFPRQPHNHQNQYTFVLNNAVNMLYGDTDGDGQQATK
eukprot:9002803-Karenia_brevis.AAC.1